MFVVTSVPQLEEAVRERAREVMVVGKLAPKMLKVASGDAAGENGNLGDQDFFLNRLIDNFKVCAIQDKKENLIAVICQRDELNGGI